MIEENEGQWFVVHTLSGQENKIRETVNRMIKKDGAEGGVYEVFFATEKVTEVRAGKKITTTRKIFPGYINIRLELYNKENQIDEDVWYKIQDTQGIIGFVGNGKHPLPLSDEEVDAMMNEKAEVEEKAAKPKINFEAGDTVRIKDGAFENFEGKIHEIDSERGKLKLMVSIFGRSTPVELEFWQVEREA